MVGTINPDIWKEYARLYHQFTPSFQRELIEQATSSCNGLVIDAGVGVGKCLPYLDSNNQVRGVIGLDSSSDMLEWARDYESSRNLPIEIYEQDATQYGHYGDADSVLSLNVIYTLKDPIAYLNFLNQQMKPGSKLVMSSQSRDLDLGLIQESLEFEFGDHPNFSRYCEIQALLSDESSIATRRFSLDEILTLFGLCGFEVLDSNETTYLGSNFFVEGIKK